MGKKRTFKIGNDIVDIPVERVDEFLSEMPDASEVQSFLIENDTVDIPVEQVQDFLKDVPMAKPLFETDPTQADSIPTPTLTGRDSISLDPTQPGPDIPSVGMDDQGNITHTVQIDRRQRDAILNSAFKVPEDIRRNPVFERRYVQDVARKMNVPEPAVDNIYKEGMQTYDDYNALKANYDTGKGTDDDLNVMGQMLLSMGRYDEALQAFKKLEGSLMNQAIKEYQPGMRQDYIDQRQAPAFIGILNAVHAKGDMDEYKRLLRIAEVKGIDLSGIPSVGDGSYMQDTPDVQSTYGFSGRRGTDSKPTPESEYLTDIASTMQRITPGGSTTDMALHGLKKIGDAVKNEYLDSYVRSPWDPNAASKRLSNDLAITTGLLETAGAVAMLTTPGGAAFGIPFEQLPNYIPESLSKWMMPVSEKVRRAYGGNPSKNAENLAVLGDFIAMAIVGGIGNVLAGRIQKKSARRAAANELGNELLQSIESMPDEQIREMFEQAEKRFEATGGDPVIYAEQVQERAKAMAGELKAIEESLPVEPYNPEPAPNTLRTVAEGVDVEYKGERGVLDRGDDGTWYFTNDEGKSTQIPVEDKFNPTESLTELDIQVLPEISKDAVARAVADAEQIGEVEYKGKRYFVSLDNPMKDNPTGDLVFERTSDGRLLNRFDSHPDPKFAESRKLAIANKFLADKGLPPREKLIEPWKEAKTKEPAAPVSAEAAPEGAVTPEGASAIMPDPNLQKEAQVQIQEPLTPKENVFSSVEETARALESYISSLPKTITLERFPISKAATIEVPGNERAVSEYYHKAKADGSNPELVSAVEEILTPQKNDLRITEEIKKESNVIREGSKNPERMAGKKGVENKEKKGGGDIRSSSKGDENIKRNDRKEEFNGKNEVDREQEQASSREQDVLEDNDNSRGEIRTQSGDGGVFREAVTPIGDSSSQKRRRAGQSDRELGGNEQSGSQSPSSPRQGTKTVELFTEEQRGVEPASQPLLDLQKNKQSASMQGDVRQVSPPESLSKNPLLEDALKEYEEATPEKKQELVEQVKAQLDRAERGESIGFPLDPEMVDAGKKFLEKVEKKKIVEEQKTIEQAADELRTAKDIVDSNPDSPDAKLAFDQAQKKLSELQGKRRAEVLKKIDDFEQWALNLPGIKDMSGGAQKAGIGAAEVVKGITDIVRKSVEAGFDIADAVADAIEKYKRLAPEFFEKVTEQAVREKFGVSDDVFRAANKTTKQLREKMGIPQDVEFTAQNKRDVQQVAESAKRLKEQGVKEAELMDKVIYERYMLKPEEQQFLVNYEMDLFNERREIERALNNIKPEEIDRTKYVEMYQRLEEIAIEQSRVFDTLERAGSEQSLVFRMRQLITKRDYSVENYERSYKAKTGMDAPKEVLEKVQRVPEIISNSQSRQNDLLAKKRELELQSVIDDLREELERERTRKANKPSLTEQEVARKKELYKKFSGRFNDITSILADKEFYEYAGLVFKEARADFKKFSERMIEELGEKISPYLKEIYDKVKRSGYKLPEMRGDDLWIDVNMLKNLVAEGVKDHTELSAKALEIVRETLPDVTERQVQNAITGYGKTINPSLDPINRELSMLKRDMKLAISLEDAKAGLGVKRSGYQPAKLTPEQREMMRMIREELKNYPEDAAQVEAKWRTALERIKSGLRNAIEDAKKRIDDLEAGRAVETKEKKITQLDDEALLLKEELADLKKRLSDLEGPKQMSAEQLVNQAIAAAERSRLEYERKADEIRRTGTYTSPVRPRPSSPELDFARAARDRAKAEYEAARASAGIDELAATSKALSAAEARLRALEDKVSRSDMSYRQRLTSLVDQSNPLLKATKERIKQQQDILKAMREASGEADRHAVELWKQRKRNKIAELNRRVDEKDYSTKAKRVLPIDDEMIRLKAEETRAKFNYDLSLEIAAREAMSKKEKAIEMVLDAFELPKSIMASLDLSAVLRQGSILGARHPIKNLTKHIPGMFKMLISDSFYKDYHDQMVHTEDYISAKDSGLHLTEPNAKLSAREELAASKLASKIPGVAASNRAYSGLLNMQRMQAFSDFKTACIKSGIKGAELKAELKNYATFINEATGRGRLPKLGKTDYNISVPLLNLAFFAPRFVVSRLNLMTRVVTGFYNFTPKARMEAYKAIGSWATAVGGTLYLAKMAGLDINTDDPTRSDYLKIKIGNQQYDIFSGFQQIFVLLNRIARGYSTSLKGQVTPTSDPNNSSLHLIGKFLRSKTSPQLSYALDAGFGKTVAGEKFDPLQGVIDRSIPLIARDMYEMSQMDDSRTVAMNMVPMALGVAVQSIDLNRQKKESGLSQGVMDLMSKAGYYPKETFDQKVYVDEKPYEISDDQIERIRKIRNKFAGDLINKWYKQGRFKGIKQSVAEQMWNDAYSDGLDYAYDEVLPKRWSNKKPKDKSKDKIL